MRNTWLSLDFVFPILTLIAAALIAGSENRGYRRPPSVSPSQASTQVSEFHDETGARRAFVNADVFPTERDEQGVISQR